MGKIVDPRKCTGCGVCYNGEEYFCPVRAIIHAPAHSRKKTKGG
jgi:ferredoxin